MFGALEEIRTPDLSVRSRVLYPAKLRARYLYIMTNLFQIVKKYFYLFQNASF